MLSITAPAVAKPRDGGADPGLFARIKNMIVHILDIVEVKTSLPPG
jgi:hypothetical protein